MRREQRAGRGGRWQPPWGLWLHSAQLLLQTDARGKTGRSVERTTSRAADEKQERRKERKPQWNCFILLDVMVKITTSGKQEGINTCLHVLKSIFRYLYFTFFSWHIFTFTPKIHIIVLCTSYKCFKDPNIFKSNLLFIRATVVRGGTIWMCCRLVG